jgi:DHA2 family multidrug resistance protein
MGYTALDSGLAQSSRGVGVILLLFPVGFLIGKVDSRKLISAGFVIAGISVVWLSHINLEMGVSNVTWPNFLQGIGMAMVFVPLTTTTMGMLSNEQMGNATGIYNLMRNIGGSLGISVATTYVERSAQFHQTLLAANVTPFNPALQSRLQTLQSTIGTPDDHTQALASIYHTVVQQATMMAYIDTFRWLAVLCIVCLPAIFLFKKVRSQGAAMAH